MSIRSEARLYTVNESAQRLGVSERRVRALIQSGELHSLDIGARATLITEDSLIRVASRQNRAGRPYSSLTAMAALFALSGESIGWVSARRRYVVKQLLLTANVNTFIASIRHRATVREYWANDTFLKRLRSSEDVYHSGGYSDIANKFGIFPSAKVEGYVAEADLVTLTSCYMLKESETPKKVRLHVVVECPWGKRRYMPMAVCAADLAESVDPRERNAGMEQLGKLIYEYQQGEI